MSETVVFRENCSKRDCERSGRVNKRKTNASGENIEYWKNIRHQVQWQATNFSERN